MIKQSEAEIRQIQAKKEEEEATRKAIEEYSKRYANKTWESVTSTFIGDKDVGKTLFIRSLWRLRLNMIRNKYKKKSRRVTR